VIVDYLHLFWTFGGPSETNAIAIVDPNAALVLSVAGQPFQAIPRRRSQIAKVRGLIQLIELSPRDAPDIDGARSAGSHRIAARENVAGSFSREGSYHRL
jgi:hypothetical protein